MKNEIQLQWTLESSNRQQYEEKDLVEKTGISPTTISKMVRGDAVSLTVIGKSCEELDTDIGDLINIEKK